MKNKTILTLVSCIFAIVLSLLAFFPFNLIKKTSPSVNWMSKVENSVAISELSIPGTHDSAATHSIADVAGKCQDLSISDQLNLGVRFFDVRIQLENDQLKTLHSFVDQKLSFNSVLSDFSSFITNNPSETLIVSIKKEAESVNSSIEFKDAVFNALKDIPAIDLSNVLPNTLGECRGKIFIISRFECDFGIPAYSGWKDSTTFELNDFYIQDNYAVSSVENKKESIQNAFDYCKNDKTKIVLNFTSCYLTNSFPPLYAGTPANEINPWLINYFNNNDDCLGIVICDFITEKLSKQIYERNYL